MKKQIKKYDVEKANVWGSPDYMKMRYTDTDTVSELPKRGKAFAEIKGLVKSLSTAKDGIRVYKAYATSGECPDGRCDSIVVHLSLGLNGGGRQLDYIKALERLARTGRFEIFDAWVDWCDDLADVLCTYHPAKR